MQDFLVLGLIPGTNIQITFVMWMLAAAAVAASGLVFYVVRSSTIRELLITLVVIHRLRKLQNIS